MFAPAIGALVMLTVAFPFSVAAEDAERVAVFTEKVTIVPSATAVPSAFSTVA